MRIPIISIIYLILANFTLFAQSKYEVPPTQFMGTWAVEKALYNPPEGKRQEVVKKKCPDHEYLFKKGKKQALYRYFKDSRGNEHGITILEVTKTKLVFRSWSAHPSKKTIITLKDDGTAIVNDIFAKGEYVYHLRRPKPKLEKMKPNKIQNRAQ